MLTGLRGVGKTVLLNQVRRMVQEVGCRTVLVEAHEDKALEPLIAPGCRRPVRIRLKQGHQRASAG